MKKIFVYVDESGNTGFNLFDDNQPFFWTAALLSPVDLQVVGTAIHKQLTARLNMSELHGAALGIAGIKEIARELKDFLAEYGCGFVFCKFEKRYHAGTMIAQMLLDTDFNRAVSSMHDFIPLFRRMLTLNILAGLRLKDAKEFWDAYQRRDVGRFVRVLNNLQVRVYESSIDKRSKQLLLDAITWALDHPGDILRPFDRRWALPNVIALDLLLEGIQQFTKGNVEVVAFYHDEQKDFGKLLKESYEMGKNVTAHEDRMGLYKFQKVGTFRTGLEFLPSHSNIGIQIVDVVLWLVKWGADHPDQPMPEECQVLINYVYEKAINQAFTYEWLLERTLREYREVMKVSLTPEQEEMGKRFIADREAYRKRRMTSEGADD